MQINRGQDGSHLMQQKLASATGLRMQAQKLQERRMQDDKARLRIEQRLEEEAAQLRRKLALTEAELERTKQATQNAELWRFRAENDKLHAENINLKVIEKQQPGVSRACTFKKQFTDGGSKVARQQVARPCPVPFNQVSASSPFGCPPHVVIETTPPSSQHPQQAHLATSVTFAPVAPLKRGHSEMEQNWSTETKPVGSVQSSSSNNTGFVQTHFKTSNGRCKESVYVCGYCGEHKKSSCGSSDHRVRIRCECGGRRGDFKRRMHARWNRLDGNSISDCAPPIQHQGKDSQKSWNWVDATYVCARVREPAANKETDGEEMQ